MAVSLFSHVVALSSLGQSITRTPAPAATVCQPSTSSSCSSPRSGFLGSGILGARDSGMRFRVVGSRRCRAGTVVLCNKSGDENDGGDGSAFNPPERSRLTSRRDMLLEYVKNVQPEFMEKFVKRAPEQVVDAMRQTVTNMLGTLPPQFFEISVSTVAENLAQLMYSVMMTGYMFRNAQFRLELQQSLSQVALPDPNDKGSMYEPGVNKSKVSGEVMRWHIEDGPEKIPAVEYIKMLESEIQELQLQLDSNRRASRGRNELLEYLKSLQPQNLQELSTTAGEDALEAMNTFVTRLLGVKDSAQLKRAATETSATELAKLLYWLMVVGYSIRNIEVRYDMERVLGMPVQSQKLAELSPGTSMAVISTTSAAEMGYLSGNSVHGVKTDEGFLKALLKAGLILKRKEGDRGGKTKDGKTPIKPYKGETKKVTWG